MASVTGEQVLDQAMRLLRSGEFARAARLYSALIDAVPQHADALQFLGLARWQQRRADEAQKRMHQALALRPDDPAMLGNFGSMRTEQRQFEAAVRWYQRSAALKLDYAEAYSNCGIALKELRRIDAAIAAAKRALALRPGFADPHSNLGDLLGQIGLPSAAIRSTRRALALNPGLDRARRNLLALCLYDPALSQVDRFALHRRHGARAMPAPRPLRLKVTAEPNRPLRIGYLSSDFRWHPVARNMLPILRAHRFSAHLYSTAATEDAFTARLRAAVPRFRSLPGRSDEAIAQAIAEDRIDILVILAAHFDENPVQVARWRPAPVIVSFHDSATTGLAEVDYLIADGTMVPKRTNELFAERVIRLPATYVYALDDVAPPPRDPTRPITFTSLNNPAKINDEVLAAWHRVLASVPGSRLLLQYRMHYEVSSLAARLRGALGEHADLVGEVAGDEAHLELYGRADIALDCFPFNGVTTSFEAMWMGVPVITLIGDTMAGRTAASLLRAAGLGDLAAPTVDAYVRTATELALDRTRLSRLSGELRHRLESSSLADGPRIARYLERAYRAMWRRWCGGRK